MDAGGDAAHETMLGIHRQEDERHCVFQQLVIRHQFAFALVNKKNTFTCVDFIAIRRNNFFILDHL